MNVGNEIKEARSWKLFRMLALAPSLLSPAVSISSAAVNLAVVTAVRDAHH